MRLIDADKLKAVIIEEYKAEFFGSVLWDILNDIPTAYDDMEIKEALEKQIPKEPYFEGDGYYNSNLVYDTWRCPNCDSKYEIEFDEHEYCPICGQAIKWE